MKHIHTTAIFILFCLSAAALLLFSGCERPDDVEPSVNPSDKIESHYSNSGPSTATVTRVTGFNIYHPVNMSGNHPIITWGNGTGAPTATYTAFLNHLASWGFVVVATESVMTYSGRDMIAGIDYLIVQNSAPGSMFYKMLDTEKIGSTGHSQGGAGAINAAVADKRIKCCAPLAPAPGKTEALDIPMFLVVGAVDKVATVDWVTNSCFEPAAGPTIFAIAFNTDHSSFTRNGGMPRGYVTAWFMFHLRDDQLARQAFEETAELFGNPNWDVRRKNYQ